MTALFMNLVQLRFDDRKAESLSEHITRQSWLRLAQAAAAELTLFVGPTAWKASLLLATIPPYINIIDNITSKEDKPTYANTVLRLKELNIRPTKQHEAPAAAAFTTGGQRPTKFCGYCKAKG